MTDFNVIKMMIDNEFVFVPLTNRAEEWMHNVSVPCENIVDGDGFYTSTEMGYQVIDELVGRGMIVEIVV